MHRAANIEMPLGYGLHKNQKHQALHLGPHWQNAVPQAVKAEHAKESCALVHDGDPKLMNPLCCVGLMATT